MKKILLLLIILVTIVYYRQNKTPKISNTPIITVTPTTTPGNSLNFVFKEKNYRASWIKIDNLNKITLLPNFSDQLSAEKIMENNNCKSGISAGFYDTKNKPLGLFITEEKEIGKEINSNFVNAILYITASKTPGISVERPQEQLRLAVQSGPLLLEKSFPLKIKIIGDKSARRISAGIKSNGELIFISVYDKDSPLLGPYLADMPEIIKLISNKLGTAFVNAVNLDGGTASAFYGQNVSLSELASVGGLFCIK